MDFKSMDDFNFDKYIAEIQIETIVTKYLKSIKYTLIFIMGASLLFALLNVTFEAKSEYEVMEQIKQTSIGIIFFMGCLGIVTFCPKAILTLVPLSILVLMFISVNVMIVPETYKGCDWNMALGALVLLLIILVPNQFKLNTIAFTLGVIYYLGAVYYKYRILPVTLSSSMLFTIIYFGAANYILNNKLRELYKLIFQNEVLIEENKKLLEIFPEAVLIKTKDNLHNQRSTLMNNEFEKHIGDINQDLKNLKKVKVQFKQVNHDSMDSIEIDTNLYKFL